MAEQKTGTLTVTRKGDREIEFKREFNAPARLVYEAHTSCEHLARWIGLRDSVMTACQIDFRPGGRYSYSHRMPDGNEFNFSGEIRETVPYERIVQTFEYEGMVSVDSLTLTEVDGRTILSGTSTFDSKESLDGMIESGMEEGMSEAYERLDELLPTMA